MPSIEDILLKAESISNENIGDNSETIPIEENNYTPELDIEIPVVTTNSIQEYTTTLFDPEKEKLISEMNDHVIVGKNVEAEMNEKNLNSELLLELINSFKYGDQLDSFGVMQGDSPNNNELAKKILSRSISHYQPLLSEIGSKFTDVTKHTNGLINSDINLDEIKSTLSSSRDIFQNGMNNFFDEDYTPIDIYKQPIKDLYVLVNKMSHVPKEFNNVLKILENNFDLSSYSPTDIMNYLLVLCDEYEEAVRSTSSFSEVSEVDSVGKIYDLLNNRNKLNTNIKTIERFNQLLLDPTTMFKFIKMLKEDL